MSSIPALNIPETGIVIRQRVTTGHSFTGVRTASTTPFDTASLVYGVRLPTPVDNTRLRGMIRAYTELDDDGEGLIEPYELDIGSITSGGRGRVLFLGHVSIRVGALVGWTLSLTDGANDTQDYDASKVGTVVDTVAHDIVLATGTGNTNVNTALFLQPGQRLRLTTAAACSIPGVFDALVQPLLPQSINMY